jgi:PilZ domain
MEQRSENRFKPNQNVTVKVLGLRPGPILQACIIDISGNGMRLRSKLPVPCGTPIEIEVNNTVASGSVSRCTPEEGSYELGVQVSETASAPKAWTSGGAKT